MSRGEWQERDHKIREYSRLRSKHNRLPPLNN